jgi:hypothetical protein
VAREAQAGGGGMTRWVLAAAVVVLVMVGGASSYDTATFEAPWNGNITFNQMVEGGQSIDVLIAEPGDSIYWADIVWYRNDGSESFAQMVLDCGWRGAREAYATDVDKDGDIDVIGVDSGTIAWWATDGSVAWWENDGSESFTKHTIGNFPNAWDVYAIDVDGDGDMDVLSAGYNQNLNTNGIAWYENNGTESFTKHLMPGTFVWSRGVYATDIDGDGDIDVLGITSKTSSPLGSPYSVAWWENDGSESFTMHAMTGLEDGYKIYATDVDGDGDIDVLGAGDSLVWYENDGSETFTQRTIDGSGTDATKVYATDMDGDGDIDVICTGADMSWYENDGSESFTKHVVVPGGTGNAVYARDVDGDGDIDLLGSPWLVYWYENDGSESFTQHLVNQYTGSESIYATDMDGSDITLQRDLKGYQSSGNITTVVMDASSSKKWGDFKIGGCAKSDTAVYAYWNHSNDNITFSTTPLGEVTFGRFVSLLSEARYVSLIIEFTTTNEHQSPTLVNISLFTSTSPAPVNITNTTGNFWVNHTWQAGLGNVTDSYNVSVNSVWHNGTPAFYNDTYTAHAWQNVTVHSYNTSGSGTLSTSSTSQNTQIPNNPITITNTSDWCGDSGNNVYVDYDATDPDGDTPTFSCSRTDWFTDFSTTTGKGNWTSIPGMCYVNFGVSDGWGNTSNYSMRIRPRAVAPPMMLAQTHEQTWVNWTWKEQGGTYYAADSWNVSVDGVWHNTTTVMHYNHTGLDYFQTSSIVVWGYNNTSQHLSYESVSGTCIISPKYGNYTIIEKEWKGNVIFNRTHKGGQSVDILGTGQSSIYWWANDGKDLPTFHCQDIIVGSGQEASRTVGAADFDGDGDIDILEDGEAWWENDGEGHFTRHRCVVEGYDGGVAADMNNDGDMDVICYWKNTGRLYYGMNNGVGYFTYTLVSSSAGYVADITTGDFDNDGDLDIAVADEMSTGGVHWYEQVSTYSWIRHHITDGSAHTVFAKDYNKDGNLDLLISIGEGMTPQHGMRWYTGNGAGGFSKSEEPINHTATEYWDRITDVFVADLNWDDNQDIMGMASYQNAILDWIWEGADEYSLWWATDGCGWDWANMYANDLNNDGNLDVVYSTGWGHRVNYALGAGSGGFYHAGTTATSVYMAQDVFAIDMNGDYIILRKNYADYEPSGDITTRIYGAVSNWTGVEIGGYNMPGTSAHAYWYHSPDNITFQMKDLGEVNFGSYINLTATAPDEKYGYLKIVLTTTNDQFSPVLAYIVLYETWCSSYNLVSITDDHGNVVKCGKVAVYDETAGEYDYKWEDNTDGHVLLQDVNAPTDHDILLTLKTFDGVFTFNTVRPKYGVTDERTTEWIIPIHYNLRVYPVDIHDEPLFNVFCGLSEYTPLDPQAFWGYSMAGSQYVPVTNCSGFAMCDLIAEKGGYEDYNATALNWTSKSALVKDYRHTVVMEKD